MAGLATAQQISLSNQAPRTPAHAQRAARFLRGRTDVAGTSHAIEMARRQQAQMMAMPQAVSLGAPWTAVGPGQIATTTYGNVTGRVSAVVIDPADSTGNTVYVGTTGGGVWKSTNAANVVAEVSFAPLTDTLPVFSANLGTSVVPSLSIGALAIGNGVLLAGTGDPNDATDSYYGGGILRSTDGGVTWTLISQTTSGVGGSFTFIGAGFAGFAFSSATPSLVVAAVSQAAEAVVVNAVPSANSRLGLYYSADAGITWQMATIMDGSQTIQSPSFLSAPPGNAATAVVWNPVRQKFYAAVRFHGYFESVDGVTWTRMLHQPGAGLTSGACPPDAGTTGSPGCPIFRGALAVQPVTGDMFALTTDGNNLDQGVWQDVCALSGGVCGNATALFGSKLPSAALEMGNGSTEIPQADYDMALAAVPVGSDTILYAGTIDLYRCSVIAGCTWRNTTNAENGCNAPAAVAGAQHAIATLAGAGQPLVYLGNDGGLWRSSDGVNETGTPCSASDATHFQNLNAGIGSLAEVVSFAQDPTNANKLLVGVGANGTAGTGAATTAAWGQLATGEGGTVAIDPANPGLWYLSSAAGVSINECNSGSACTATNFAGLATIGATQVGGDTSAIDAPWLLDPALTTDVVIGTCRVWRGPAASGAGWSSSSAISRPFGASSASACGSTLPVVRSLSAGGTVSGATASQDAGSTVLYAGLAGTLDGGVGLGGHLFVTKAAGTAGNTTVWTDAAAGTPVTNDTADAGKFNPGGFDISSVAADPHDATGATIYVTAMGFANDGVNAPHVYRSIDFGAHWTNISSNLPNAPANSVVVDPNDANTLYVAMDTGVYVTSAVASCTSANCWSIYGTSLPNAPVVELAAAVGMTTGDGRSGELRAATYGRGIWEIPLLTAAGGAAPAIGLNPASLTFGAQQVGTASVAQVVTVSNTGTATMTVSSVTAAGDFTQTNTCTSVAVGTSCTVSVTFLPSAVGTRAGLLTVYANVPGGQGTVALTGPATAAASIVLLPVALTFPATAIGVTSVVQNITVSNTGGTTTALQKQTITGNFAITANSCGTSLASQVGCTVSIAFTPTASGLQAGTFTIVDGVGTQTASLMGTGTSLATDALAPLALTFAAQVLNTASAAQVVTLTNSGDVALTLISAQITSGDFTVVNGCGNSLNGHSSCALSVTYVPKNLGAEAGVMALSDQIRSQQVVLNGTGIAPAGVSVSPVGAIAFGAISVGATSVAQVVTLTNNGGVVLALEGVAVTGDFGIVAGSNGCGGSLSVGAACTLQVVFTPTVGGGRTGTISFSDGAANSPQMLALSGTGIDFTLAPNGPTSVTVASGTTAMFPLLVSSNMGVTGTVAFTCTGAPVNAVCSVTPVSAALGTTTTISVTVATGLTVSENLIRKSAWMAALLPLVLLRRKRRLGPMLVLLTLVGVAGCGWGRLVPGIPGAPTSATTPGGTSTIVVTGSSAGLVRSVTLTLIVQ